MPSESLELSYSLNELPGAASQLWHWAAWSRVFAFSGSLGAGKTTFIHALCDVLQVKDTVSSPTFALINEYRFDKEDGGEQVIFHMDWYRLRDADEAIDAGMEDALNNPEAICFVEWPEKAPELLHIPHIQVSIETVSETERRLKATPTSNS
jgi:tRNA threonylcarbamoyladenosine biosynthesis protein TsaE